jgi:DNA-binding transcriptional ArsR family regulator
LSNILGGILKMPGWTFITNHGMVLAQIAKKPRSTAREIAQVSNITERTAHKLIADLEAEGYVERQRVGRNNIYRINPDLSLRHETNLDVLVGDLLKLLGWKPRSRCKPSAEGKSGS